MPDTPNTVPLRPSFVVPVHYRNVGSLPPMPYPLEEAAMPADTTPTPVDLDAIEAMLDACDSGRPFAAYLAECRLELAAADTLRALLPHCRALTAERDELRARVAALEAVLERVGLAE